MNREPACQDWQTIRIGSIDVRYYVREPSPGRWNTIGLIPSRDASPEPVRRHAMVVGVGDSCIEAMGDLIARVVGSMHPDGSCYVVEREPSVLDRIDGEAIPGVAE